MSEPTRKRQTDDVPPELTAMVRRMLAVKPDGTPATKPKAKRRTKKNE